MHLYDVTAACTDTRVKPMCERPKMNFSNLGIERPRRGKKSQKDIDVERKGKANRPEKNCVLRRLLIVWLIRFATTDSIRAFSERLCATCTEQCTQTVVHAAYSSTWRERVRIRWRSHCLRPIRQQQGRTNAN